MPLPEPVRVTIPGEPHAQARQRVRTGDQVTVKDYRRATRTKKPEAALQRAILDGCRLLGVPAFRLNSGAFVVSGVNQWRRFFRATFPGCPDLVILLPDGRTLWVETKASTGVLSPVQMAFRDLCQARNIPWVCAREWEDVVKWLQLNERMR